MTIYTDEFRRKIAIQAYEESFRRIHQSRCILARIARSQKEGYPQRESEHRVLGLDGYVFHCHPVAARMTSGCINPSSTLRELGLGATNEWLLVQWTLNEFTHWWILLTQDTDSNATLGPMIAAADTHSDSSGANRNDATPVFSVDNILGNSFIFLFAGHETTANSITFLLIFLALNLPAQRRLQLTVDTILASHGDPAAWPYPLLFNALGNSYAGASINEQLRLIASVTMIPKRSVGPQTLTLDDGKTVHVPPNTFQHFCAPSVHRNPKVWPHSKSLRTPEKDNDLDDFVPERWLLNDDKHNGGMSSDQDEGHKKTLEELNGSTMDIGSAFLFSPPRGAFVPFSDGPRACLGRRFAMVELVAVITTIMQNYSVELDTRDFAEEEKVMGMGTEAKQGVYKKAQDRAWQILEKELGGLVTLQCVGRKIPLRFCKRGGEVFRTL